MPTFGTLAPPRGRFFLFRGALGRALAPSERTNAISHDFGAPGGTPKKSWQSEASPSGREVKLHLAPLGGDIVRVSTTFALSQGM